LSLSLQSLQPESPGWPVCFGFCCMVVIVFSL
jgi:hypothetical protein